MLPFAFYIRHSTIGISYYFISRRPVDRGCRVRYIEQAQDMLCSAVVGLTHGCAVAADAFLSFAEAEDLLEVTIHLSRFAREQCQKRQCHQQSAQQTYDEHGWHINLPIRAKVRSNGTSGRLSRDHCALQSVILSRFKAQTSLLRPASPAVCLKRTVILPLGP